MSSSFSSGSNDRIYYELGLDGAIEGLQAGQLDPPTQQTLATTLNAIQTELHTLPVGLLSPRRADDEAIEVDEAAFAAKPNSFAAVLKKRSGGTLQLLPCTKAMKNRVRNIVEDRKSVA